MCTTTSGYWAWRNRRRQDNAHPIGLRGAIEKPCFATRINTVLAIAVEISAKWIISLPFSLAWLGIVVVGFVLSGKDVSHEPGHEPADEYSSENENRKTAGQDAQPAMDELKASEVLRPVAERLDASGIAWCVFGGAAATCYGVCRAITDIDILLGSEQAERIAALFPEGRKEGENGLDLGPVEL